MRPEGPYKVDGSPDVTLVMLKNIFTLLIDSHHPR